MLNLKKENKKDPILDDNSDVDVHGDEGDIKCMFCDGLYSEDAQGE